MTEKWVPVMLVRAELFSVQLHSNAGVWSAMWASPVHHPTGGTLMLVD